MNIISKIKTYILEDEFKVIFLNGRVNIVNYKQILDITDNKITLQYNEGKIIVNGQNLVISKLLKDEVLITGVIKSLELR